MLFRFLIRAITKVPTPYATTTYQTQQMLGPSSPSVPSSFSLENSSSTPPMSSESDSTSAPHRKRKHLHDYDQSHQEVVPVLRKKEKEHIQWGGKDGVYAKTTNMLLEGSRKLFSSPPKFAPSVSQPHISEQPVKCASCLAPKMIMPSQSLRCGYCQNLFCKNCQRNCENCDNIICRGCCRNVYHGSSDRLLCFDCLNSY